MAILLHGFLSSGKRYIQLESQPHYLTGIFRKIMRSSKNNYCCKCNKVDSTYFECEEDGTVTFYVAQTLDTDNSGIWTYLVYDCPYGQEKIFSDSSINTNINILEQLFSRQKLIQVAVDIHQYLQYQYNPDEYLDVHLPQDWNDPKRREIAHLLVEEIKAFKALSIFTEDVGKEYIKAVLDGFIQAAQEIIKNGGTLKDFESAQYDVLNRVKIDDVAHLILDYNDYRIWQAALPSKSKAVEYAFNTALKLICRMR